MFASFIISQFTKQLGVAFTRFLPYFLALLATAVISWILYNLGYNRGVEATDLKYQIVIEEERHRQIKANDVAIQESIRKQKELEILLEKRDSEIEEILNEGRQDPNSGRRALSPNSVRRINRIR